MGRPPSGRGEEFPVSLLKSWVERIRRPVPDRSECVRLLRSPGGSSRGPRGSSASFRRLRPVAKRHASEGLGSLLSPSFWLAPPPSLARASLRRIGARSAFVHEPRPVVLQPSRLTTSGGSSATSHLLLLLVINSFGRRIQ
ncbi:hypothetical protein NL676_032838 [Syzygium grande]|nr:hypothetical protein NL676_032838 [Syzygium grande]